MASNQTYDANVAALPARASLVTIDSLRQSSQTHGFDLAKAAELYSSNDWMHDMAWLQRESLAHNLSKLQRDILVARLRARNQEAWGAYARTDRWSVYGEGQ